MISSQENVEENVSLKNQRKTSKSENSVRKMKKSKGIKKHQSRIIVAISMDIICFQSSRSQHVHYCAKHALSQNTQVSILRLQFSHSVSATGLIFITGS